MNTLAYLKPVIKPDAAPSGAVDQVIFKNVSKQYITSKGTAIDALKQVNLTIHQGEIFGIIGRSGAGKSSLIRTINRLEEISTGELWVDGLDVKSLSESDLVKFRRRIGMIFQHFNLLSSKTVFENLALPLKAAGHRPFEIRQRADYLLRLVGLEDKADAYPSQLSGGQKQRVGIARALMLEPDILLCDEATSALDPETTHSILKLLKDINQKMGLTIILITHEMAVIREICDRVTVLEAGRVVEQGEVWQIFGAPQHEATKALLEPLKAGIPDDLQHQLSPEPANNQAKLLIRVFFDGIQQTELNLGSLLACLGEKVQLLNASIDRIQGHSQGQLLLTIPSQSSSKPFILNQLKSISSRVEVLGYVSYDA